jgi:hypothetical protein
MSLYTPKISDSGLRIRGVTTEIKVGNQVVSGGGLPGYMPRQIQDVDKDYIDYEHIRFTLKQAWNTHYRGELLRGTGTPKPAVTPFRAVTNSGDLLSRVNYSCGGSCQTFQSRPGMFGLRGRFGAIQSRCDNTGVPPASCNVKYVYDSSDYTTYLKQKATSQNYNDITYGGDQSNASQSALRHIKRY